MDGQCYYGNYEIGRRMDDGTVQFANKWALNKRDRNWVLDMKIVPVYKKSSYWASRVVNNMRDTRIMKFTIPNTTYVPGTPEYNTAMFRAVRSIRNALPKLEARMKLARTPENIIDALWNQELAKQNFDSSTVDGDA